MDPVPLQYLPHYAQDYSGLTPEQLERLRQLTIAEDWRADMEGGGLMVVYANDFRSLEVITPVVNMGAGAGRIPCPECEGTGTYEFHSGPTRCPQCKGSGFDYVSAP
ncbi:hypothetical protein [Caenimonas aquaedulcis]|uniref:Uncharacterized protein n=1 Tax=Caenimonas aquaedulcis TaxID=2793270 RepID=A0A931H637_9BURK|nr:hypothetical protein [Caenimonas aquaedulcis]MBG9389324.1 hypothetical protein [Caenimonas aquaedulcis]